MLLVRLQNNLSKAGLDGSVYITAQCAGHPSVLISTPDRESVFPSHEIYTVDLS